ncbi:MAG: GNAT family N-acetyltransferase [Oxalobacteraceae bacterium]|nr:GNAT family N-acetyltransferase [Oxalobacteraceae bacterium]
MPTAALFQNTLTETSGLAAEFHRWPLPGYIWPALHGLYQSIFCSEPHLRHHDSLRPDIQAWVARSNGGITGLILFQVRGRVARVINEMHALDAAQLNQFAQALFREYTPVDTICLHALRIEGDGLSLPLLQTEFSEDYVLSLPDSAEAWKASLSSQTREKIRYHYRRSCRRQPDLSFRQIQGSDMSDAQFDRLLQLSQARMAHKGRSFNMGAREAHCLRAMIRECGQLSVIEIQGEICAGLLCTRLEKSIFMHVIAHDPRHDDLRLGFLCCALTIEAAIASRAERFHFLWGFYDYKTRLGGQRQSLYRALVFRSWWHGLSHPLLLGAQLVQRARRKIRQWRHH